MTNTEAIKKISERLFELGFEEDVDDEVCALNMAIKALEQQIKRNCNTCKHKGNNKQPCKNCGTIYENYTNWELKEI